MADPDQGDKTEDPTDKRRSETRQKGNVAKSVDVNAAATMLVATGGLLFLGPDIGKGFAELMQMYLSGPVLLELDGAGVAKDLREIFFHACGYALPFIGLMFLCSLLTNLAQIGFLFTTEPLNLKWNRLNPISGFQRIFSIASLVRLGTSVGKIIVMAGVASWFISMNLPKLLLLLNAEPDVILSMMGSTILELSFQLALAMLVIAILDFSFQKWKYEQDLKMSKQEIRDEMKNMDGDPHIRQKRKEAHRKLAAARELGAVQHADVVVTNPTHISVAIRYDPKVRPAPYVVAKGMGEVALKIREIAREHDVPIIERKPLARALYKDVKVGHPIPTELYEVFVEIMAYVYRLTGRELPE
ncbi:flagellar biosynthesis protein FlhB [Rubinisphaera margarita]|uniref:flagellar biosynthesis protein FlhB n=1 Tax=Rubinisphaera margarita TaxID=2909586 RepID=UPI001EE921B3|nr:flagellar biosynthesis protein FlhB [Rubinisphaera margarita]MCG6154522.1 flagellar biosynthesis protein FlhB [Rubinisphaera margarita]